MGTSANMCGHVYMHIHANMLSALDTLLNHTHCITPAVRDVSSLIKTFHELSLDLRHLFLLDIFPSFLFPHFALMRCGGCMWYDEVGGIFPVFHFQLDLQLSCCSAWNSLALFGPLLS